MVASSTSTQSTLSVLREQISIPALENLARYHGKSEHVIVESTPLRGSHNLVYPLTFPDGRKWVARIPDPQGLDIPIMQSDIVALRLIREKTTIPVPAIHAYDTSSDNELGVQYVLMDFVDGIQLSSVWKDRDIVDAVARKRIFEQVAGYMSQLGSLQFNKIGHLQYHDTSGTYSVGPCRMDDPSLPPGTMAIESGPFSTTHAYLSHMVQSLIHSPRCSAYIFAAIRVLALSLPDPRYDGPPFVMSHPDFDSQNILVDPKTFTINGFIDWDGILVGPRLAGFARYPAWITRDWDPAIYYWIDPKSKTEDDSDTDSHEQGPQPSVSHSDSDSSFVNHDESPETLQSHRDLYCSIYSKIDPENADITRQSHIFEAIMGALSAPPLAAEIVIKLYSYVFNADRDTAAEIVTGLGNGDWLDSLQLKQPDK